MYWRLHIFKVYFKATAEKINCQDGGGFMFTKCISKLKINCQDAPFFVPFLTFQYVAGFPCPSPAAGPARWNPVPLPGSSPARFCKLVSDQTMRLCLPVNLVNNAPHYNIKTKRYSVEVVDW